MSAPTGAQPGPVPRAALRAQVLDAARAARRPGRAPHHGPPHPPVDAIDVLLGQVESFAAAAAGVPDWAAPTAADLDAQAVLAHVAEIERYLGSLLGLWPYECRGPEHDHRAMTAAAIDDACTRRPDALLAAWRADAGRVLGRLRRGPCPTTVALHRLPLPLDRAVALRAFELWTHADDLRRAAGRPLATPPPAHVALLTDTAVAMLPLGMGRRGVPRPDHTVKLVLCGPGGGTWVTRLGPHAPAVPTCTLITDVLGFCRVAADRSSVAELEVDVDGDPGLAHDVLVGAGAFAA